MVHRRTSLFCFVFLRKGLPRPSWPRSCVLLHQACVFKATFCTIHIRVDKGYCFNISNWKPPFDLYFRKLPGWLFHFCVFWLFKTGSCNPAWPGTCSVAQNGLEFLIFLPGAQFVGLQTCTGDYKFKAILKYNSQPGLHGPWDKQHKTPSPPKPKQTSKEKTQNCGGSCL